MTDNVARLDGLVPDRLRPKTRKIVLEDYRLDLDIGFHDFEIGNPQRLLLTVEVWVDESSFADADDAFVGRQFDEHRVQRADADEVDPGTDDLHGRALPSRPTASRDSVQR